MLILRTQVNKALRLSYRASHRLLSGHKYVHAEHVTAMLNGTRKGSQPMIPKEWVPSMLLTAEELAAALSNEITTVTPRDVINWTRRQLPVPHFALSSRNLLFDKAQVEMWMQYSPCRRPKPAATAADTATAAPSAAAAASNTEPAQPTE
jgi:hypothetical protein